MAGIRPLIAGIVAGGLLLAGLAGAPPTVAVEPDPIIAGCNDTALPRNDDGSSAELTLPFAVTFGGRSFTSAWVNNNGNITFDAPLATYTPFGLAGTARQIIAPFFADVDTRATGSLPVTYSWGTATFDGRPALCVNWIDVGYYNTAADKTDAFQLVLVDRGNVRPGSFDIMFNYRRIQWETGNASGGVGGLGGTSAAAGFSNGAEEYYEMPGSLVPGSFLDGAPRSLAATSNVGVPGRWVWPMRAGTSPTKYVAMGDSFQSGEGAYDYETGTDQPGNRCHRSEDAYARLLTRSGGDFSIGAALTTTFVACSGARMAQMTGPYDADKGFEPAQVEALGDDTALVTLGVAGNDLEFASTITACVEQGIGSTVVLNPVWNYASCERWKGGDVRARLNSLANGDLRRRLGEVYARVRKEAPRAKVIIVNYPQFYRPPNWVEQRGNCAGVRGSDQVWINEGIKEANGYIASLARSYGFSVADMTTVFGDAHGLCSGDEAMNGLIAWDGEDEHKPGRGTYHPNKKGHELFAARVRDAIPASVRNGTARSVSQALEATDLAAGEVSVVPDDTSGEYPPEELAVEQGAVVELQYTVAGTDFSASTHWQDGAYSLRITSPSGRVFSAAEPTGSEWMAGDTYERLSIPAAEPGVWTVALSGDFVPSPGQLVSLVVASTPQLNRGPIPSAVATVDPSGNVVLDARGSRDPEGEALSYAWDFGDGASGVGAVVSHRYPAGVFVPSVVVTDARGATAVAQVPVVVRQEPGAATPTLVTIDAQGNEVPPVPSVVVAPPAAPVKAASSVALTMKRTSKAKSVTPRTRVALTATVAPAQATGTVTFADSGHLLGTAPVSNGKAALVVAGLYGGVQRVTATYDGDDAHSGGRSASVRIKVKDTSKPKVDKPRIPGQAASATVRLRAADTGGVRAIEVRTRSTAPKRNKLGRWGKAQKLPGSTTAWTIPSAASGSKYCVSVRARNYAGRASAWKTACRRLA